MISTVSIISKLVHDDKMKQEAFGKKKYKPSPSLCISVAFVITFYIILSMIIMWWSFKFFGPLGVFLGLFFPYIMVIVLSALTLFGHKMKY